MLAGNIFQVEAGAEDTITTVKERITASIADTPVERQKLIHAGKVLKDTQTVGELNIGEGEFIVCMVSKEAKVKLTNK